jgi:hypothetical protein
LSYFFPIGTTTVNCYAADSAGNVVTTAFDVSVTDVRLTLPGHMYIFSPSGVPVPVAYPLPLAVRTYTDGVLDGTVGDPDTCTPGSTRSPTPPPTVTCSPASGHSFGLTDTNVHCTAIDGGGNSLGGDFIVTVAGPGGGCDYTTTIGSFSVTNASSPPKTVTATAATSNGSGCTFYWGDGTSTTVSPTGSGLPKTCAASHTYCAPGPYLVGLRVTSDGCAPVSLWSMSSVTVAGPLPVITCPADVTAVCTGQQKATVDSGHAGATDCATVFDPPTPAAFPLGTTDVIHTATNNAGTSSCTNEITVVDTTAPTITCPADVTAECNAPGSATAVSAGHATASDTCDAPLSPTVSEPGAATYPLGSTTVTHSARDSSSNSRSCTNTVTVVDTTPPVFDTVLSPQTVVGNCSGGQATFTLPTAHDTCQAVTVTCPLAGTSYGTNAVTCTATDPSGNHTSTTITVNLVAPLRVVFQPPLADDNVADDINTDADVANVFQVKQTIPHQVKLLSCAGDDVTDSVAVTVRLTVRKRTDSSTAGGTNIVPTYNGVGDSGGLMVLVDHKYKYNLATDAADFPTGTLYNLDYFDSIVSVFYNSAPSTIAGQEDARLESK